MKRKTLLSLFVFSLFSVITPLQAALKPLEQIVAVVNDDIILESELAQEMKTITAQIKSRGAKLPSAEVLQRQVLERLIIKHLQLDMAEQLGIRVDDLTLNQTMETIAKENKMSLDKFRRKLERDGIAYTQFRRDIHSEIIMSRLQQSQIHNRVFVSDEEIDNYLANLQTQGVLDNEYRLSHILIAIPEAASPEQVIASRSKAEELLLQLQKGADFNQLAISQSAGQQALQGGDLGWRRAGELPTLFADEVKSMKMGQISGLIRSASGFHILKLQDIRSGGKTHYITQTQASHILIRSEESLSDNQIEQRLKSLRRRSLAGESFSELARANSEDPGSAAKGGELGWVNPGTMVPEFEEVMAKLKPGEISKPFKSRFGWHIIKVFDRRQYNNTTELTRNKVRESIRKRKIEENTETWLQELRQRAYIDIRI